MPPPEDADPRQLAPEIRRELRPLSRETADIVARHLIAVEGLVDEDPARALAHARAARAYAGRIGVVREIAGVAAYRAGEWQEALTDLRAARRLTGSDAFLPYLLDCERALGRPERALDLYRAAQRNDTLDVETRAELVIVASGARRDLGQPEAAVVMLQDFGLQRHRSKDWAPRLWYAYADALLETGRTDEAHEWFANAAAADVQGLTDAEDRLLALNGPDAAAFGDGDEADAPSGD